MYRPDPERDRDDAGRQVEDARHQAIGLGQQRQHDVHHEPDHQRVQQRADAWALTQRDPQQQQRHAHDHDHDADRDVGQLAETLMEHVPRRGAQFGLQDQRDADAEQHQTTHAARQTVDPVGERHDQRRYRRAAALQVGTPFRPVREPAVAGAGPRTERSAG